MAENYGKKGWIKLWRAEMDNPLYSEEPFTKWQAWIDLCLLADSKGTVKTSLEALKNRWLWSSIKKVRNYLGTVQGTGMGTVIATPKKGTLILINKDFSAPYTERKKSKKGTDKGTDKGTEEVTSVKEVGDRTSLISPAPDNNTKNNMQYLEDELGDEYES